MACRTRRLPAGLRCVRRSSGKGGDDFANSASPVCRTNRGRVARGAFPPEEVAQVKAIACELTKTHGVPLSRFSRSELYRFVVEQAIGCASASTIGRWLAEDAIKPWQQRSWIFPRDPNFREKAGPILDLYEGRWEGKLLEPGDGVISAEPSPRSKPGQGSTPARHPPTGVASASSTSTSGAARSATSMPGTCGEAGSWAAPSPRGGIAAFDRLVWRGMTKAPYRSAPRVFWIVDHGSDARRQKSIGRLQGRWPNLILVHPPSTAAGSTRS